MAFVLKSVLVLTMVMFLPFKSKGAVAPDINSGTVTLPAFIVSEQVSCTVAAPAIIKAGNTSTPDDLAIVWVPLVPTNTIVPLLPLLVMVPPLFCQFPFTASEQAVDDMVTVVPLPMVIFPATGQ